MPTQLEVIDLRSGRAPERGRPGAFLFPASTPPVVTDWIPFPRVEMAPPPAYQPTQMWQRPVPAYLLPSGDPTWFPHEIRQLREARFPGPPVYLPTPAPDRKPEAGNIFVAPVIPPATPWIPATIKQTREALMPGPPPYPPTPVVVRPISYIFPGSGVRVILPQLVEFDPRASIRSRRHQQLVAEILNSLIRSGELIKVGPNEWALGFMSGNDLNWAAASPDSVNEALDRLAALLAALNGGIGP